METVLQVLLAFGGLVGIGVAGVYGLTLIARGRSAPNDPALTQRLATLEEQVGEARALLAQFSAADQQLGDLEERVEFLERLLQEGRIGSRLQPPEA